MNEGANLPRLVDPAERVIELLAIKLFEHDAPSSAQPSWLKIAEEDREIYRRMARGEQPLEPGL